MKMRFISTALVLLAIAPVTPAFALTAADAGKAALAAQAGTVTMVEPEDESGVSVYGVHITAADGKQYDVKVDATTGAVLKSEPDTGVEAGGGSATGGGESGGTSETNQG